MLFADQFQEEVGPVTRERKIKMFVAKMRGRGKISSSLNLVTSTRLLSWFNMPLEFDPALPRQLLT